MTNCCHTHPDPIAADTTPVHLMTIFMHATDPAQLELQSDLAKMLVWRVTAVALEVLGDAGLDRAAAAASGKLRATIYEHPEVRAAIQAEARRPARQPQRR